MSLVGPRPERPEFVGLFEESVYRYSDRHRVKAGITGWAQVNGLRGKTSLADRVEWDNYYIENWSLWLDVKIAAPDRAGGRPFFSTGRVALSEGRPATITDGSGVPQASEPCACSRVLGERLAGHDRPGGQEDDERGHQGDRGLERGHQGLP